MVCLLCSPSQSVVATGDAIENKVTRPLVTRRLSISGAFSSLDFTAASRAKIGGAPAAVSNF